MQNELLVVSTVRDVEKTLFKDIVTLRKALGHRFELSWFFVESDSTDCTEALLRQLSLDDPSFRFMSLGSLSALYPEREERLAKCRNVYLSELENHPDYKSISYLFVADCDGLNTALSSSAVDSCFAANKSWDACFPNQKGPYHDIYALRHPLWNPTCLSQQIRFCENLNISYRDRYQLAIYSRMITIPISSEWISVYSAFGGCAFYRANVLRGLRYSCRDHLGNLICEHVNLNFAILRGGGSLYINPAFINSAINTHSRPKALPWRLLRGSKGLVRQFLEFLRSVR